MGIVFVVDESALGSDGADNSAVVGVVVALVDGQEFLLSDVENVRRQLPAQAQNYTIETFLI